jgi:hypothetical protein
MRLQASSSQAAISSASERTARLALRHQFAAHEQAACLLVVGEG